MGLKHGLKWGAVCLLVYVGFLLAKLPASKVISLIDLPTGVSLRGVSGTIWHGRAQQIIAKGLPLNKLSWQLDVLPLLWGSVSAQIKAGNMRTADEISFKTKVQLAKNSFKAQELQAYLPTNLLISLLPLPFPVNAQGRFRIQLEELNYTDGCQALKGKGQWLKAEVAGLNGQIVLGNFDAQFKCDKSDVLLEVNEPNSFGLSAIARIPQSMQFSVEGKFKPDPNLPREVQQAAQFFGQPDGQGYYPLKF
ncbi:MAG: general secretion pathway protein N [Paraglaciecola sp.]|jgi:general secretion pathway protein N